MQTKTLKLKPNTIFVAAEEKISFDVTSLERNKTVEGNFALMELRNTSIEREGSGGGERERERTQREYKRGRCWRRGERFGGISESI